VFQADLLAINSVIYLVDAVLVTEGVEVFSLPVPRNTVPVTTGNPNYSTAIYLYSFPNLICLSIRNH